MTDDPDIDDILGQLAYVASHPDAFEKADMINVIKAAMAEIMELRVQLASGSR